MCWLIYGPKALFAMIYKCKSYSYTSLLSVYWGTAHLYPTWLYFVSDNSDFAPRIQGCLPVCALFEQSKYYEHQPEQQVPFAAILRSKEDDNPTLPPSFAVFGQITAKKSWSPWSILFNLWILVCLHVWRLKPWKCVKKQRNYHAGRLLPTHSSWTCTASLLFNPDQSVHKVMTSPGIPCESVTCTQAQTI